MNFCTGRYTALCLMCALLLNIAKAQDIDYARKIMDTLSSPSMYGRGYVNNGSEIAAEFLESEMKRIGLQSFDAGFRQPFSVDVMTYPSNMSLSIDGKQLKPGYEFTVFTGSPTLKGTYTIQFIDSSSFRRNGSLKKIKKDGGKTFICYDPSKMKGKFKRMSDSLLVTNFINCAGFIHITTKASISWSVMLRAVFRYPVFTVLESVLPTESKSITIDITAKPVKDYRISNVIGYIKGTTEPDSFIVMTAHYDHLGMMGPEVYFPGANDNASGTAMILDLARYYSKPENKPGKSIVFMAFAGEEIGLEGSDYYVENPVFPLKNISFLINLDMVGTGSEGITMVNATQLPAYYEKMVKINADNEYILKVAKRGESCNSDHCPFYKKGVPAIFIYSMGKEHIEYHNPEDKAAKVPFTEYNDIFSLLRDYINAL